MIEKLIPATFESTTLNEYYKEIAYPMGLGFSPDITTNYQLIRHETSVERVMTHKICLLNTLGYIPLVSTVTGGYRALIGFSLFIHSYAIISLSHWYRWETTLPIHKKKFEIGVYNLVRGLVEMVPIIGNLYAMNNDANTLMVLRASVTGIYGNWRGEIYWLNIIDVAGGIPLIGTIVNLARAIFFTLNAALNLIEAKITDDEKYRIAARYAIYQVAIGLVESIPVIGTISALMRQIPLSHIEPLEQENPFSDQYKINSA